jgi:SAM-dependent methyltransferase
MPDALRPSNEDAQRAWAARVRANREQVDQFREALPEDFYAPIAGLFRGDPHREEDPTLAALRALLKPDDALLDIGAGGGRLALPLARVVREVIAVDPSRGMLKMLEESIAEHGAGNIRVVQGRWPEIAPGLEADVALISHLGYDVEAIGPFLDAMEAAARRMCVAVLLERPPPTEADRMWPAVHGVERAALPSLPEFLNLLVARGTLFEVKLVERAAQTYEQPEQAMIWLRSQLWTRPGGSKDQLLRRLLDERATSDGAGLYAISWDPVRVGIVTWLRSDRVGAGRAAGAAR